MGSSSSARLALGISCAAIGVAVGWLLGRHGGEDPEPGTRFRSAAHGLAGVQSAETPRETRTLEERIEALKSLGYAAGSRSPVNAGGVSIASGLDDVSGVYLVNDGHAPSAWLMDEAGRVLHTWEKTFDDAFEGNTVPDGRDGLGYFRRVRLLPEGELLAIFEGHGLVRLDADSNLVWGFEEAAHHDLDLLPDGNIVTLTRRVRNAPELSADGPVLEDLVVELDPQGRVEHRFSVFDAVRESPYRALFENTTEESDLFHTNAIAVLDGRSEHLHPEFRRGRLLLSLLGPNAVVVVDPVTERVVWALAGVFKRQHEPTILQDGRLLVFDNQGDGGKSQLLEIDLATHRVEQFYSGQRFDFHTPTCGAAQRLPSGLTLITESDPGRAFIVTREGEIVWEYYTPHRAGPGDQYIATLFEVQKLPDDVDLSWLRNAGEVG